MELKLRTMLTVVVVLLAMGSTVVMGQMIPAGGVASDETEVFTNVTAGIVVSADNNRMPLDNDIAGSGVITGTIPFTVHANVQEIDMYVIATALYKGDDKDSLYGIPISGTTCNVQPDEGNALDGDNNLLWDTSNLLIATGANDGTAVISGGFDYGNGFLGLFSEIKEFESNQSNRFSQAVVVTVTWENLEDELPVGMYSGYVKLVGLIPGP